MHAPLLRNGQPCKVVSHEIWFGGLSLRRRDLCSKCETCPKGTGGKREAHTIGTETYRTPKGQDETRFTTIRKQQATKDRRQEPNHNKKRDVNASTPQPNFSPTDALLSISLPLCLKSPTFSALRTSLDHAHASDPFSAVATSLPHHTAR